MAVEFAIQVILRGLDHLTAPLRGVTAQMDKLSKATETAQKWGEKLSSTGMRMAGAGAAIGAATVATLGAFTQLEGAQVEAINAFSNTGGVSKFWEDINRQAIEAGNLYPGTTADFLNLAASMKMAGADAEQMAAGGFKAAAAIQVMFRNLGLGPREAGTIFQTTQNAMGIGGKDALFFADQLQRLAYTAPIKIQGISDALKYAAADMKALGIQGKASVPMVLATMGALSKGGLEDSQVGSSMGQFFQRLAIAQKKITGGDSRGAAMKAAFEDLHKAGIEFNFFDGKGKFLGMGNALLELEKLKGASDMTRSIVGKALFGVQGQRMLTAASLENVTAQRILMLQQETLQTRLNRITGALGAKWEALQGSTTNALAAIGEKMAPTLKPLLDNLNAIVGKVTLWIDRNPELVGQLGIAAGALGAFLIGGGGAMWVIGGIASTAAKAIPVITSLGAATWTALPWLAAIGAAGYLIYKNWDTVGPIFGDVAAQMADVGRQVGALIQDVLGIVGLGTKVGEEFHFWAAAAFTLAKAIQLVVTGVQALVAITSSSMAMATGSASPVKDMRERVAAFTSTKGSWWDKFKAADKVAQGQSSATIGGRVDAVLRPFEGIAKADPLGVNRAIQTAQGPAVAPISISQPVSVTVNGGDPEKVKGAVLDALRENSSEIYRLMVSHRQVATRGAY